MALAQGRINGVIRKILAIGVLLGLMSNAFAADYTVIANKSVSAGSLGKNELQAIFLGEKTKWDDGKPIKIVVLEDGNAHKAFLKNVIGKTPSQFENYWKKQIFTGKAAAPKSFGEMSSLVDYVAGQAGAIGYVASSQSTGSTKTITIK